MDMAGGAVRTSTLVKVLESLEAQARRAEMQGESYAENYGRDDLLARSEYVRAEAVRSAVDFIVTELGLDRES